jgi:hypothetical protein
VPYLNLSEPWWNGSFSDNLKLGGKVYFVGGDSNMGFYSELTVVHYNKTLAGNYGMPDLYQVVIDGKWTLDYLSGIVKDVYKDLNGDGIMDADDQYGIQFPWYNGCMGFMDAAEARLFKNDGGGYPRVDPDYERLATLTEKVYDLLYNNPGGMFVKSDYNVEDLFKNRKTVMYGNVLYNSFSLRDMEDDIGILPYPKYDEFQEHYRSGISPYMPAFVIPLNCEKTELAGAFMEAAASYGYNHIIPKYFEEALKIKIARDEQTAQMIDIIREGAYVSFEQIYCDISGLQDGGLIAQLMQGKKNSFASWFEKNEGTMTRRIDNFFAKIEENTK